MPRVLPKPIVNIKDFEFNCYPQLSMNEEEADEQRRLMVANIKLGTWQQRLLLAVAYDNIGNLNFDWDKWKKEVRSATDLVTFCGKMGEWMEYIRMLDSLEEEFKTSAITAQNRESIL
jgi:hypothetical protein